VIGTIALIGLVIATGLAYTIITSYIEAEVTKQQLNQIAEHVALNLVKIANLVNFANFLNNATIMKVLRLPLDLGGKAYVIKLINETRQGRGCYVYVQLVVRKDVAASSPIPLNSTQAQLILITDGEGTLQIRGEKTNMIQYSSTIYGGAQDIVVWGWKKDESTTLAGIGVWKSGGGY